MSDEIKPRVRVKARREIIVKVGGVYASVFGYEKALSDKLKFIVPGNVHKIDLLVRDGDYDRYRVIHD